MKKYFVLFLFLLTLNVYGLSVSIPPIFHGSLRVSGNTTITGTLTNIGNIYANSSIGIATSNIPSGALLAIKTSQNTYPVWLTGSTSKSLLRVQNSNDNGLLYLYNSSGAATIGLSVATSYFNNISTGFGTTTPQRKVSIVGDLQVTGNIYTTGAMYQPIATIATNTLLTNSHDLVLVDCTSATVNITLPAVSGKSGLTYRIKKIAGSYPVIVDPNASETIDGATTKTISATYSSISIRTNGTAWFEF